jgi:redox-sensitive bicupin YhaK (pirin superfamily)
MNTRKLQQVIRSIPTSDGAGVKLRRSLGQAPSQRLDPFLMLDEFSAPRTPTTTSPAFPIIRTAASRR